MLLRKATMRVSEFAFANNLYEANDRLLLAVSGGRDSMCMLTIFETLELEFSVAHMNYQLRGEESNRDADFVQNYCEQRDIKCYIKQVDCRSYMANEGLGVQEAARDLRYSWMSELAEEHNFRCIATAHHQDDNLETFLINLMRGTGLRGLKGIPFKRGNIIRPLMCFDSRDIESIIEQNNIVFCTDSSNETDDYLRNRIRRHLVPLMHNISPGSVHNMIDNIQRFKGQMESMQALALPLMIELKSGLNENGGSIAVQKLLDIPSSEYILAQITSTFGFTAMQCADILHSEKTSGIGALSATHEMIRDREMIRIQARHVTPEKHLNLKVGEIVDCKTGLLSSTRIASPESFSNDRNIEYVPAHSFEHGGLIRRWRAGDRFSPFGMTGTQKVSDLLTNLKYSTFQKRDVLVLLDNDQIVWVVGVRLSARFKVDLSTKEVIQLQWVPTQV